MSLTSGSFYRFLYRRIYQCVSGLIDTKLRNSALTHPSRFYTLAVMPRSVIEELRNEIKALLQESDGKFTNFVLQSMKKVDSFIKETMRVYPFANRK